MFKLYFGKFRTTRKEKFEANLRKKGFIFQSTILMEETYEDVSMITFIKIPSIDLLKHEIQKLIDKRIFCIVTEFNVPNLSFSTNSTPQFTPFEILDALKTKLTAEDACFLCRKPLVVGQRSMEHVISDWIIQYTGLKNLKFQRSTSKENKKIQKNYTKWKIDCCTRCNQFLSLQYEQPISAIIKEGFDIFSSQITTNSKFKNNIMTWLGLFFTKSFYADIKGENPHILEQISPEFEEEYKYIEKQIWLNILPQSFISVNMSPLPSITNNYPFGSIFVFKMVDTDQEFDYVTSPKGFLLMRIKDIGIILSLKDSGFLETKTDSFFKSFIETNKRTTITGLMLRELFAIMLYENATRSFFYNLPHKKSFELIGSKLISYQGSLGLGASETFMPKTSEEEQAIIIKNNDIYKEILLGVMHNLPEVVSKITEFYASNPTSFPILSNDTFQLKI